MKPIVNIEFQLNRGVRAILTALVDFSLRLSVAVHHEDGIDLDFGLTVLGFGVSIDLYISDLFGKGTLIVNVQTPAGVGVAEIGVQWPSVYERVSAKADKQEQS
jgi:hypothetical protein